jgi:galactosamine-6-phosphate isomerase
MQLKIFKDYHALSSYAANEVVKVVKDKPEAVLCLAAGDTPRLTYALVAKKAKEENVDFTKCTFVGLDEWVGIPPENEGSCFFFLQKQLFNPRQISSSRIHLFNGLSRDLAQERKTIDMSISEKGGIDLMLVEIGMNGHTGFNEPGNSADKFSRLVDLDDTTQSVAQKYFKTNTALNKGITLGLKHLLQSGKLILGANGSKKSQVIRKALEEEINENMPASIITKHPDSQVIIDEEAASQLRKKTTKQLKLMFSK